MKNVQAEADCADLDSEIIPSRPADASSVLSKKSATYNILLLTFAVALFSSALLLFLIQPLVGKALLPRLGGTPQVWTTCMVFFQAMLFAGYLHAHFTGVFLGARNQALLHIALAALALLALPIGLASASSVSDSLHPVLWLLLVLLLSIGAPMFIVSSTAPLLQKWFSHTNHPSAHDPYFLYAASNLGSLLALLGYPLLVEPSLDLGEQFQWWSAGFLALVIFLVVCLRLVHPMASAKEAPVVGAASISGLLRVRWLLLSFAPSSLLLGVTTYLTTDVAAVPLLWIIPLALYLITFIIAFATKPLLPHQFVLRAQAILVALLAILVFLPVPLAVMFPLHLLVFFFTALMCHGELAASRPGVRHLTEFYLWLSLGGVLGGIFNALIAPFVFDRLLEYPLALGLACLLRPGAFPSGLRQRLLDLAVPLVFVAAVALGIRAIFRAFSASPTTSVLALAAILMIAAIILLSFSKHNWRFGIAVGAMFLCWQIGGSNALDKLGTELYAERSFFGIHKVFRQEKLGLNVLAHGTTVHGAQHIDPTLRARPLSYYHREGPFGDLLLALAPRLESAAVAAIGLGTGALACYGSERSSWTFYEIDPLVEKIARDPRFFTYLQECPPKIDVVLGDARLSMQGSRDASYALIIVDAFSSDAIPTHLLTREAIASYLSKLAPDGVLAIHISNRHIDLGPVVGNLAEATGLTGRIKFSKGEQSPLASAATLTVLARRDSDLGPLSEDQTWRRLPVRPDLRVWSDDYINLFATLKMAK